MNLKNGTYWLVASNLSGFLCEIYTFNKLLTNANRIPDAYIEVSTFSPTKLFQVLISGIITLICYFLLEH